MGSFRQRLHCSLCGGVVTPLRIEHTVGLPMTHLVIRLHITHSVVGFHLSLLITTFTSFLSPLLDAAGTREWELKEWEEIHRVIHIDT